MGGPRINLNIFSPIINPSILRVFNVVIFIHISHDNNYCYIVVRYYKLLLTHDNHHKVFNMCAIFYEWFIIAPTSPCIYIAEQEFESPKSLFEMLSIMLCWLYQYYKYTLNTLRCRDNHFKTKAYTAITWNHFRRRRHHYFRTAQLKRTLVDH